MQLWTIDKTPGPLKLDFALWTRKTIAQLVKDSFHDKMTIQGICKYLKHCNITPQKPILNVYARDEKKVQKRKETIYPAIVERVKHEQAEFSWGDETGIRSVDVVGRSYAPHNQSTNRTFHCTPIEFAKTL